MDVSDLLIRNLDEEVKVALRLRAERNERSLSAEIRDILGKAASESRPRTALDMMNAIFAPESRLTPEEAEVFGTSDHPSDPPDFSS